MIYRTITTSKQLTNRTKFFRIKKSSKNFQTTYSQHSQKNVRNHIQVYPLGANKTFLTDFQKKISRFFGNLNPEARKTPKKMLFFS